MLHFSAILFAQNTPYDSYDGPFKSISSGFYHSVALKEDGTIVQWGKYPGITPAGLTSASPGTASTLSGSTGVKAIAAGIFHMVALRENGTVVEWKALEPSRPDAIFPVPIPAVLKNVKAIDAGKYHAIALKEDGSVALWGAPPGITVNIFKQPENRQAGKHKGRLLLSGNFLSVPKNAVATLYNLNGRILAQWTAGRYELNQVATVNDIYSTKVEGKTERTFKYIRLK